LFLLSSELFQTSPPNNKIKRKDINHVYNDHVSSDMTKEEDR